jgi:hypothetical protein
MESVSKNINWNAGVERIIKRNIYIGNYEGAIDCALKSGRIGEALLLVKISFFYLNINIYTVKLHHL